MKVPVFRAKDKDSDEIVEGFYFNYPQSSSEEEVNGIVMTKIQHCLLTYRPVDPNDLPTLFESASATIINEPIGCNIDIKTLEFVRYEEVSCNEE
jgi:hypothetical protein